MYLASNMAGSQSLIASNHDLIHQGASNKALIKKILVDVTSNPAQAGILVYT